MLRIIEVRLKYHQGSYLINVVKPVDTALGNINFAIAKADAELCAPTLISDG